MRHTVTNPRQNYGERRCEFDILAVNGSDVRAERLGLFVIRATGSGASITNGQRFRPRTFGHRSTASATS